MGLLLRSAKLNFLYPCSLGHKRERVAWKPPKYLKSPAIVKILLQLGKCFLIVFFLVCLAFSHGEYYVEASVICYWLVMHNPEWHLECYNQYGNKLGKERNNYQKNKCNLIDDWLKPLFQDTIKYLLNIKNGGKSD